MRYTYTYAQPPQGPRDIFDRLRRMLSPAVMWLIGINVAIFVLFVIASVLARLGATLPLKTLALLIQVPEQAIGRAHIWQFVTYMFVHAGFGHLFFNMLILFFFGPRLEYRWGTRRFLIFYFLVGVGAGLFHPILMYMTGRTGQGLVGASGVLYGMLVAWALYWPDDIVYIWFVIPVRIKWLVIFLAGISLLMVGSGGGVSHLTHLAGAAVAFVYLKWNDWFGRGGGRPRRRRPRPGPQRVDTSRHPEFR